jgi:inositol phosphorylceramide mannosyltransferase catalytic subunit
MQIPRVFHQVWVGPDPLPAEFVQYRQTWLDHHPGWELRFWTEDNLPEGLRRTEVYQRIRSPAERSDILRLELVYRYGGVYVDTDFECLRSLEPLIEDVDFFIADIERGRINNAIVGAIAGHPILDRALDEIRPREFFGYDKEATGPLFLDRVLKGFSDATVFGKDLFYAQGEEARRHGYAIHHEANAWKDARWLRHEVEKERHRVRKARKQAASWRAKYEQSEARLDDLRRLLMPAVKLRRLLKRP